MVDYLALRIAPARTRTRVSAPSVHACQIGGTIRVQGALRSTSLVRITGVIRQARTRTGTAEHLTHRIGAAGRRCAGINGCGRQRRG